MRRLTAVGTNSPLDWSLPGDFLPKGRVQFGLGVGMFGELERASVSSIEKLDDAGKPVAGPTDKPTVDKNVTLDGKRQ